MAGKVVRKTFYDRDFIPKDLEELYNSGWKDYMLYHIRKYVLNDVNNSPEDLLQDMMVQLAEKHYLDAYDPSVSDFTVYLHTFIRNFMSKPYAREHNTLNGSKIINYVSIVSDSSSMVDEDYDGVHISTEVLASGEGDFTDALCIKEALEGDLRQIKSESKVIYDGKVLPRTPYTVYRMMLAGYDIKEIAEIFGTSKQFVYSLRKKITDILASYA